MRDCGWLVGRGRREVSVWGVWGGEKVKGKGMCNGDVRDYGWLEGKVSGWDGRRDRWRKRRNVGCARKGE